LDSIALEVAAHSTAAPLAEGTQNLSATRSLELATGVFAAEGESCGVEFLDEPCESLTKIHPIDHALNIETGVNALPFLMGVVIENDDRKLVYLS